MEEQTVRTSKISEAACLYNGKVIHNQYHKINGNI